MEEVARSVKGRKENDIQLQVELLLLLLANWFPCSSPSVAAIVGLLPPSPTGFLVTSNQLQSAACLIKPCIAHLLLRFS